LFVLLPFVAPTGERSPLRRPWAIGIVGLFALSVAVLVGEGSRAPWSPNLEVQALPGSVTTGLTGSAAQGATLFAQKGCLNCHTIAGAGGARGPDLTQVGARLDRSQLTTRILNGGTNMPGYGASLRPDELSALVDFLQTRR
jgi:ubiquinol-cytochrome c reductase cytochrome b subunit